MKEALSFDDVLIVPKFSTVISRKDVDTTTNVFGLSLKVPVISANMDSVTGVKMSEAMYKVGGIGCLHRFQSIENNVKQYIEASQKTNNTVMVSFGLGEKELERCKELYKEGAHFFLLDVAHGASTAVIEQVRAFRQALGHTPKLIVGNFATGESIKDFLYYCGDGLVDGFKVGIGGGSACITRVVTGCGLPTFSTIQDCAKSTNLPIIADGGIRNSGDVVKAIAAGASLVMVGKMLAGTYESPGEIVDNFYKKYRGSASASSYQTQGKESSWRTPEGDEFLVRYVGSVSNVLQNIEAGIRSAMSYCGIFKLNELTNGIEFVKVTTNGHRENGPHGK